MASVYPEQCSWRRRFDCWDLIGAELKLNFFPEHIGLHIRAVGEWTNRLLEFFEKEQKRLHNGEVPAYNDQATQKVDGKHNVVQAYVTSSTCEKVNERSEGVNMKMNMIIANENDMKSKMPFEKAKSMPNMENKMIKK